MTNSTSIQQKQIAKANNLATVSGVAVEEYVDSIVESAATPSQSANITVNTNTTKKLAGDTSTKVPNLLSGNSNRSLVDETVQYINDDQQDDQQGSYIRRDNSATVDPGSGTTATRATRQELLSEHLRKNVSRTSYEDPNPPGTSAVISNVLEEYTSYNCIISLGVLSKASINDPKNTYRKTGADFVVARTGGGLRSSEVQTYYDSNGSTGMLEYFVDDFAMKSVLSPNAKTGMSIATNVSFKVLEPYSLGMFLQSLEAAANAAGYLNYLSASYIIEIDFIGWDSNGNAVPVNNASRKIPIKLHKVDFDVESGGSTYQVSAYPWNEQTLADSVQRINDPISIQGDTVADALSFNEQSLTSILNKKLQEVAEQEKMPATSLYVVRFPKSITSPIPSSKAGSHSATTKKDPNESNVLTASRGFFGNSSSNTTSAVNNNVYRSLVGDSNNINSIGQSKMVMSNIEGTDRPFPLSNLVASDTSGIFVRNNIEYDQSERTFKFPQGMTIQKIIEEIVLISGYSQGVIGKPDEAGMIDWFKIEVECYVLDRPDAEEITRNPPMVYVYNVVPYKVHMSTMLPPAQGIIGKDNLARQISKEYNYLYTGANKDVLQFDIEFNTAFFEAVSADRGNYSPGSVNKQSTSTVDPGPDPVLGQDTSAGDLNTDSSTKTSDVKTYSTGGSAETDPKKNRAKHFHNLLLNSSTDLIVANVSIWGDPYFLPDSGLGNYSTTNGGQKLTMNSDGTMDYQRSEVDIRVNFRTPVDYNNQGMMDFQGDTTLIKGFSGFYKVTTVETLISGNQFTQNMKLVRRKNQSVDGVSKNTTLVEKSQSSNGSTQAGTVGQRKANAFSKDTPGSNPRTNNPDGVTPLTT